MVITVTVTNALLGSCLDTPRLASVSLPPGLLPALHLRDKVLRLRSRKEHREEKGRPFRKLLGSVLAWMHFTLCSLPLTCCVLRGLHAEPLRPTTCSVGLETCRLPVLSDAMGVYDSVVTHPDQQTPPPTSPRGRPPDCQPYLPAPRSIPSLSGPCCSRLLAKTMRSSWARHPAGDPGQMLFQRYQ